MSAIARGTHPHQVGGGGPIPDPNPDITYPGAAGGVYRGRSTGGWTWLVARPLVVSGHGVFLDSEEVKTGSLQSEGTSAAEALASLGRLSWSRTGTAEVRATPEGRGASPVGLYGRWFVVPGVRRVRVLRATSDPPLTVVFPDAEVTVTLQRGDWVAWDVDRERVAVRADGPWEGVAEHWVGHAFGIRPAFPVRTELAPKPGGLGDWVVRRVGGAALVYVLLCALLSAVIGSAVPVVLGTSYVHYLVYIATFAHRRGVAFPRFVRDALFFKTLSMLHLGWIYLAWWSFSPVSLLAIVFGVGLSMRAAQVLGFERTYFGWELGRLPPERVNRWPYGVVPHPMIVGAGIALFGVALQPEMRAAWPWLVPGHVLLYLAHLVQEIRAEH